jgi:phage protein D
VIGPSGADILPNLSGYWREVTWEDAAGKKSDKATFTMIGPPSVYGLPPRDSKFTILAGWQDTGPILQGVYSVQNWAPRGNPKEGDLVDITLKAADFIDNLKQHGHKHYDNQTFQQIIQAEAQAAGLSAVVDPALASISMPYQLRWSQSPLDFMHNLSEIVGGTLKLANGQVVVMKRGGGSAASGQQLAAITIVKTAGYSYSCNFEPRPQHGQIAGAWLDSKGNRQLAQVPTGLSGPVYVLPHPYRSQTEAQQAAKSEAYERGNNTFSGDFEMPGNPTARAEAPVTLTGFGWPIDGPCKAEHIKSTINSDGGYKTTVSVKSGDSDKGKSST